MYKKRRIAAFVVILSLGIVNAQNFPGLARDIPIAVNTTDCRFYATSGHIGASSDGTWVATWIDNRNTPGSTDCFTGCTLFYKKFDQGNTPGQEGTLSTRAIATRIITDTQGDVYILYTTYESGNRPMTLAKIQGNTIIFQRPITTENIIDFDFVAGSDGHFAVVYIINGGGKRFMRISRTGSIVLPSVTLPANLLNVLTISGSFTSDLQGNLFFFTKEFYGTQLRAVYYKVNERDGSIVGGAIRVGPDGISAASDPKYIMYANQKIHMLWIEQTSQAQLYYGQFNAITNQPIVPYRRISLNTNGQGHAQFPSLAVTSDNRVNIGYLEGSPYDLLFAQLDQDGAVLVPPISLLTTPRPVATALTRLAQVNDRPHIIWSDYRHQCQGQFGPTVLYATVYRPTITGVDNPNIGRCTAYQLNAWLNKNENYFAAASLGTVPGIILSNGRRVPLNPDALFFLSSSIFTQQGILDNSGQATLRLSRLPIGLPEGLTFYLAFVTIRNGNIAAISDPKQLIVTNAC